MASSLFSVLPLIIFNVVHSFQRLLAVWKQLHLQNWNAGCNKDHKWWRQIFSKGVLAVSPLWLLLMSIQSMLSQNISLLLFLLIWYVVLWRTVLTSLSIATRMPSFGISVKSSQVDLPKAKAFSEGDSSVLSDASEMSLDGWDGIALEYSVDWPLQLFFTQDVLSK